MTKHDTEVLVVGGSLVGLSAAVFLAHRGVKVTLVEPHVGSHPHPRAVGYTQRTMELFQTVGLGGKIPEAPKDFRLKRAVVESLAGRWREGSEWTPPKKEGPPAPVIEHSPHSGAAIAQDILEPTLRERARESGADLRLGSKLTKFTQDTDGVTATIEVKNGRSYELRSAYMIGADGGKSLVREALGIGRQGPGHLQTVRSVLFRAPELDVYLEKKVHQFEIEQPDLRAFLTTYGNGRWVLMFLDEKERTEDEQREALVKATGRPDIAFEIITTGRWELGALIADRFQEGRVFLAGDAAHALPPTRGGFGANTGIADVHNLAWKLEAVLCGKSSPALLDTYQVERRPVAWTRMEQTFARPDYAKYAQGFEHVTVFDDAAMEFGQIYRSAAIVGAGEDLPAAAAPDVWKGQPGTRAPYVPFAGQSQRSTLDLVGQRWTLIATDSRWAAAAAGLPIDTPSIATDDARAIRAAFGLNDSGATLVRPDGVIAWRAKELSKDARAELGDVFHRVAFTTH
ncbi:FAD-dependent monooxygenase [Corallococcus sp. EGB]|uniref:FAD-dependent monooxygenase n=1 Tax=Corallococcus sp. EGB TaxID=1521117 RepID=UPI001CBB25E8|nr:FAD-dependent monooxygenase [Corallococcus sp. EGB]